MITQAVLNALGAVLGGLFSLIPDGLSAPGWVTGSAASLHGLFDAASSMGVWIPLDVAFMVAGFLINLYIGGGVIKGIRILISHFTGGGGSAA